MRRHSRLVGVLVAALLVTGITAADAANAQQTPNRIHFQANGAATARLEFDGGVLAVPQEWITPIGDALDPLNAASVASGITIVITATGSCKIIYNGGVVSHEPEPLGVCRFVVP